MMFDPIYNSTKIDETGNPPSEPTDPDTTVDADGLPVLPAGEIGRKFRDLTTNTGLVDVKSHRRHRPYFKFKKTSPRAKKTTITNWLVKLPSKPPSHCKPPLTSEDKDRQLAYSLRIADRRSFVSFSLKK